MKIGKFRIPGRPGASIKQILFLHKSKANAGHFSPRSTKKIKKQVKTAAELPENKGNLKHGNVAEGLKLTYKLEEITYLNLFKYAFNLIQNWQMDTLQFHLMVLIFS